MRNSLSFLFFINSGCFIQQLRALFPVNLFGEKGCPDKDVLLTGFRLANIVQHVPFAKPEQHIVFTPPMEPKRGQMKQARECRSQRERCKPVFLRHQKGNENDFS